jgi:hypothetical protein
MAVDAATAPASVQLPAQQQQQQQQRQQQQGFRGPRRSSTSSLWPVQQQWIQQQQQQQQQQLQRLQQLCRYPNQHWQQVHQQQSDHNLHSLQDQRYGPYVQQLLQQQWPAELVHPPAADESVLLDISALWRENQREMLAGQQQQQWMQQHLLLQHQQAVWVAVHQPKGPGSPAAVWVKAAQLELTAEQLQLSGPGEQQQALVRLQRPDMGQGPVAVVEGLTFQHSSSLIAAHEGLGQAVLGAAVANAGDADAAGDSGEAAAAAPGCEVSMAPDSSSPDSSSSSSRYDYLLLCSGEFSVVEHHNMFPNSLAHCADGRALHNARSAADVASFVAEPREPELRQHMINLIRQAWDRRNFEGGSAITPGSSSSSGGRSRGSRGLDPRWVMGKVLQRWGAGAMVKFGVDDAYFSARFVESGLVTLPAPTVGAAVPDVSAYSSAGGQQQ